MVNIILSMSLFMLRKENPDLKYLIRPESHIRIMAGLIGENMIVKNLSFFFNIYFKKNKI